MPNITWTPDRHSITCMRSFSDWESPIIWDDYVEVIEKTVARLAQNENHAVYPDYPRRLHATDGAECVHTDDLHYSVSEMWEDIGHTHNHLHIYPPSLSFEEAFAWFHRWSSRYGKYCKFPGSYIDVRICHHKNPRIRYKPWWGGYTKCDMQMPARFRFHKHVEFSSWEDIVLAFKADFAEMYDNMKRKTDAFRAAEDAFRVHYDHWMSDHRAGKRVRKQGTPKPNRAEIYAFNHSI